MQLSRLLISNLAFTRARKMDTYLLLASETDPAELSSHSENVLVLHDRYFQEALGYPENSMESIVYRGAAAYVEFMFSHFL